MTAVDVTYVFDGGYLRPSLISAFSVLQHRPGAITLRFLVTEDIPALHPAAGQQTFCGSFSSGSHSLKWFMIAFVHRKFRTELFGMALIFCIMSHIIWVN